MSPSPAMRVSFQSKLLGKRFGRLRVTSFSRSNGHSYYWNCICDCGKTREIRGSCLTGGTTTSCGCYRLEMRTTHGMTKGGKVPAEYRVWSHMRRRCEDKLNRSYQDYGGRGISVCSRWSKFENFFADMGERPSPKHCIERKNNSLGYSKRNCVWATRDQQARNKRNNVMITAFGKTQCVMDWAREIGISHSTLRRRIKIIGLSPEDAINMRLGKKHLHGRSWMTRPELRAARNSS
jgi:hypothetical protein